MGVVPWEVVQGYCGSSMGMLQEYCGSSMGIVQE